MSVIEVASGEYGDNVIPSLVKAWKAREESMTQKKSLTNSTSCSYDSRNMVVSMLPNCNVKTSTDSIIHAASQTTQVSDVTPHLQVLIKGAGERALETSLSCGFCFLD